MESSQRSPSPAENMGPAHCLSIINQGTLSQSEKRGVGEMLGEGFNKGFLERAGRDPGIL